MALGKNGRVHVAWMGSNLAEPKAAGKATPMLYARLTDAGDGFEPQKNMISAHPGLDGGGSVAADHDGNVYVAWHAPKTERNEEDRFVWVARSTDNGKTFAPEIAANIKPTGVCGCCGMKISAGPGGRVFIAYRSAAAGINRDLYLLASTDHAETFTPISVDPWHSGTCVMSTADISMGGAKSIAAWETKGHIRFLPMRGALEANKPSSVPGEADNQKHPAVAVNRAGQFIVAWTEGTGWNKGGRVAWQVFDSSGVAIPGQMGHADALPAWSMPAVFTRIDGQFGIVY